MFLKDEKMRNLVVLILLIATIPSFGQDRHNAVGLRGGGTWGVTYDYIHSEYTGISGLISFREKGMQITGLLKFYRPAFQRVTDRFWWYFGFGAHVGYHKWKEYYYYYNSQYYYYREVTKYAPVMGIDGNIGIEFRMDVLPITISVDYLPYFELLGKDYYKMQFFDFGFGIKYTFN
jgi:hypothetical protein